MRGLTSILIVSSALAAVTAAPAGAAAPGAVQAPPASPPAQAGTKAPDAVVPAPPARGTAPENYSYDPAGRRDPFLNLTGRGGDTRLPGKRSDGAAGLSVAEITVRGILQSSGSLVAMVQGPDNKTYLVRQGDRFADGTIKTITPQALIIVQEVNDPLSLVKQREIRKQLRSLEDGKQ